MDDTSKPLDPDGPSCLIRLSHETYILNLGHRRCDVCDEIKPLDQFYRFASGLAGRRELCKPCYYQRDQRTKKRRRKSASKRVYLYQGKAS